MGIKKLSLVLGSMLFLLFYGASKNKVRLQVVQQEPQSYILIYKEQIHLQRELKVSLQHAKQLRKKKSGNVSCQDQRYYGTLEEYDDGQDQEDKGNRLQSRPDPHVNELL